MPVRRHGAGVEVVDVQAHDRRDLPEGVLHDGRHPDHGQPGPPPLRRDPHALDLTGVRRGRSDLRLEHDGTVLDPGERPAGGDQFADSGAVQRTAIAQVGGNPDLLGEHGGAGRKQDVELVASDATNERVRGDPGRLGHRHERLPRADLTWRPPRGDQPVPQRGDRIDGPDDRRAPAAVLAKLFGEGLDRVVVGVDRDEIGAVVAQRHEAAVDLVSPDVGAQRDRCQSCGQQPGCDEHVGHRPSGQQVEGSRQVRGAQRTDGGGPQHVSSFAPFLVHSPAEGCQPLGVIVPNQG